MVENNFKKVILCLPARNVAKTLHLTLDEIPADFKQHIILVDNASRDGTPQLAREAGLKVIEHEMDRGYGGSQKTLYKTALADGADIVVMLHPDHQYDAKVIPALVRPIIEGEADAVFGSRMLGGHPLEGGMPVWKYNANIFLTSMANLVFRRYLTEIHSGFRAYSRKYLETVQFEKNSNNFVFDTEIIAQGMSCNLFFREVPIVTRYFPEASSINFRHSVVYGFGILWVLVRYMLHKMKVWHIPHFEPTNNPGSANMKLSEGA
ncbi:MAG: glycosyltransferase family 2 protein [Anaerolineales bacterium]|nr:glycosyltransferase family 2 protein [Anaerolineales bacterium]